jgi:hypothetical protein
MATTVVRISAEPTRTRLLITQGPTDIGKVILPPLLSAHRHAAATLLEGLSLWLGERLCVVVCVDEHSTSCAGGLLDGLGYGERSVFYEVGVATRGSGRRAASGLRLAGNFRDLRQLTLEAAR